MCLSCSWTVTSLTFQAPSHTVCYLQLTTAGSRFLRPPTVNKSLIMPYNWTRRMPASSTTSDDRSPCVPTPPTPTEVAAASGSRNCPHPSTWIPLPSPTASAPSAPVSPAVSVAVECSDGYRTPHTCKSARDPDSLKGDTTLLACQGTQSVAIRSVCVPYRIHPSIHPWTKAGSTAVCVCV